MTLRGDLRSLLAQLDVAAKMAEIEAPATRRYQIGRVCPEYDHHCDAHAGPEDVELPHSAAVRRLAAAQEVA